MSETLKEQPDVKKIQNLPIWDPNNPTKNPSEKEEKWLRELRTYEFMNLEEPGLMMKFTYGNTKKKHTFTLMHGGKYQLPRFIVRHIESKATPIWKWQPDGSGQMTKRLTSRKPRFQLREVYE